MQRISIITKETYCMDGCNKIYCRVQKPSPSPRRKLPAVIVCHGFGGSHTTLPVLRESLLMAGMVVISFDFCGGQKPEDSQSDGSLDEMSVFTEQSNLNAVIDMTRALSFVDAARLYLVGESQGGFVSAVTASARPQDVHGLFLLYPAFIIPDNTRRFFTDKERIPEHYSLFGLTVGETYFREVYDYDIYSILPEYAGPVHIFHGSQDTIVPVEYSERALESYSHCLLTVFPEEKHGFSADAQQMTARLIAGEIAS